MEPETRQRPQDAWQFTWDHLGNQTDAMKKSSQTPSAQKSFDDLVRIPANSKSRFSLEEHNAHKQQIGFCYSFLGSIDINHGLVTFPQTFTDKPTEEPYRRPKYLVPGIPKYPESLAANLFQCSTRWGLVFTVEEKDPSILWKLTGDRIFDFWHSLMTNSPNR